MAYSINFELPENQSADLLLEGLGDKFKPDSVVYTEQDKSFQLKADTEKQARQLLVALVSKLENQAKKTMLDYIHDKQEQDAEKHLLATLKLELDQHLSAEVEKQDGQLQMQRQRNMLNQAGRQRANAQVQPPAPENAIMEVDNDTSFKLDNIKIQARYEHFLRLEMDRLNQNLKDEQKYQYHVSLAPTFAAAINGPQGGGVSVNMRHGFSVKTDELTLESAQFMVAAGKAYLKATREAHPDKPFPGFHLRCQTQEQAAQFKIMFESEGMQLNSITFKDENGKQRKWDLQQEAKQALEHEKDNDNRPKSSRSRLTPA